MERSRNQNTERMRLPRSEARSTFWRHKDSQLAKESAQIEAAKRWAEHDGLSIETVVRSMPETHIEDPYASLEAQVGHAMMFGEIDATEAYERLGEQTPGTE